MTMNLIQIQDKLKSLPNDPRVMRLLTGYANGQSPHVPPYLALGELNRRKTLAEEQQAASAGQPPGGTVKDQIEQQAGVMSLKQGQQQQAMQNMVRQGMAGAAPVPQNTPQPQAQGQVMAAAGGGLDHQSALAAAKPGRRWCAMGALLAIPSGGSQGGRAAGDH